MHMWAGASGATNIGEIDMKIKSTLAAALAILTTAIAAPTSSNASAFFAWEVTGVEFGDTLNVRRWPAPYSQKRGAFRNGTVLQMTGKCKNAPHLLDQISGLSSVKQRELVRYMWCELYHDPDLNGTYEPGWIYMKYAKPLAD